MCKNSENDLMRRKGSNRVANLFRMLKRKQDELLPSSTPKTL